MTKIDDQEVLDLYKKGYNDPQIAKKLNVSRSGIFYARHRLNLKAQKK